MSRRALALIGLLLASGCLYNASERTDATISNLAVQPYDLLPPLRDTKVDSLPSQSKLSSDHAGLDSVKKSKPCQQPTVDVQTTALMQQPAEGPQPGKPKIEPKIPPEVPGSETPLLKVPLELAAKQREMERVYPPLPELPMEPKPLGGPNGMPYTLSELQQLAAANSPTLRQAASDVEAARGNLIQARAYPNPTVGWNVEPSNDGSTAAVQGPFFDQTIKFAGKLKLAAAAAEMDLRNAELALKRARSDLSTAVRNAYFALLVAKETMRVNRALAVFTDEIYILHVKGQLGVGAAAPYEPAALRAQTYAIRLAYKQSIQAFIYAWKQLVAAIGLRQLPLTEVSGRIDTAIPYFDYEAILAYALRNHTNVLTARNGLEKAKFNLKTAQITPYPDVDFNVSFLKEYALAPKQFVHTVSVGMPFPIWDRNQGNIMAAEAALVRASEEPHRVETSLTTTLATAYTGYKQNLDALEYYRRMILPDQVMYYRGVLARRQIDINANFSDLVTAQQTLASNVSSYLGILGSLWSSVVSVADVLQTDDLFQLARPQPVPPVPDLDALLPWPCCHPGATKTCPAVGNWERRAPSTHPEVAPELSPICEKSSVDKPAQAAKKPEKTEITPASAAARPLPPLPPFVDLPDRERSEKKSN
jgi:cobalt-zinc-cadmium efflux system outer membrane protein